MQERRLTREERREEGKWREGLPCVFPKMREWELTDLLKGSRAAAVWDNTGTCWFRCHFGNLAPTQAVPIGGTLSTARVSWKGMAQIDSLAFSTSTPPPPP